MRRAIQHAGQLIGIYDCRRQRADADDFAVDDDAGPIQQNDFGRLDIRRAQDRHKCHDIPGGGYLRATDIPRALGIGDESGDDRADALAARVAGIGWIDAVGSADDVGLVGCL